MTGCPCSHDTNEHGSLTQFPTRMCLVAGCDCNGTEQEVVNAAVERMTAKARIVHDVTDEILKAADYTVLDSVALDIATAICARWELEAK